MQPNPEMTVPTAPSAGCVKRCWVNVSQTLGEKHIAFEAIDDGLWQVYFGPLKLGRFHERLMKIEDEQGRLRRKQVSPMSPD